MILRQVAPPPPPITKQAAGFANKCLPTCGDQDRLLSHLAFDTFFPYFPCFLILVCSLFTVPSSVPFLTFLPFLFLPLAYVGSYDVSDMQSHPQGGMNRGHGPHGNQGVLTSKCNTQAAFRKDFIGNMRKATMSEHITRWLI